MLNSRILMVQIWGCSEVLALFGPPCAPVLCIVATYCAGIPRVLPGKDIPPAFPILHTLIAQLSAARETKPVRLQKPSRICSFLLQAKRDANLFVCAAVVQHTVDHCRDACTV